MNECLRCGKNCGIAVFCDTCQVSLIHRVPVKDSRNLPLRSQFTPLPSPRLQFRSAQAVGQKGDFSQENCYIVEDQIVQSKPQSHPDVVRAPETVAIAHAPLRAPLRAPLARVPQVTEKSMDGSPLEIVPVIVYKPGGRLRQWRFVPAQWRLSVKQMRWAVIVLLIFVLIALLVDSVLVSLSIASDRYAQVDKNRIPVLTVATQAVYPGQVALLHFANFPASSHVLLTRDIGEWVRLDTPSPVIAINAQGTADAHVLVEDNWGMGIHYFEAEDMGDHYTATAILRVIGTGRQQAPHLQIEQSTLDMGRGLVGVNSVHPIKLANSGGGAVTWTAKSDQPWLMVTPNQGMFTERQRVFLGVSRAQQAAGTYQGIITFFSSTGDIVPVHVHMEAQAIAANAGAILVVSPVVHTFVATDGGANPADQQIRISNPGNQPLHWSLDSVVPTVTDDQAMSFLANMDWLSASPHAGVLAPKASTIISLAVHSSTLLPGVYSGVLSFISTAQALDSPQPVAVSLTVQPRCGLQPIVDTLAFVSGDTQKDVTQQALKLSLSSDCPGYISWNAFSPAAWLHIQADHGEVFPGKDSILPIAVDASGLHPGSYSSYIVLFTDRHTQTVNVVMTVLGDSVFYNAHGGGTLGKNGVKDDQRPGKNPSLGLRATGETAPSTMSAQLSVSPTQLSFISTQGQGDPDDQTVTLSNPSADPLFWRAGSDVPGLFSLSRTMDTLPAGQSTALVVHANVSDQSVGNHSAHLLITVANSANALVHGRVQSFPVQVSVIQPCTLQVSPTSLSFDAALLQANPPGQAITLRTVGNCTQPVTWTATINTNSNWLSLSSTAGSVDGDGRAIIVRANADGAIFDSYHAQITFSATDSNGTGLANTPQSVSVTLNVYG